LVTTLALAACGGDSGGTTTPSGPGSTGGGGKDGKALFAGSCGACHTLADAGTSGTFGPNLDTLKPDKQRVLHAIATGPGGMPDGLFKGADADAVATYVSSAAGK
jgi:mono/diheme cytochrome c family protein